MPDIQPFRRIAVAAHPKIEQAWIEANAITEFLQISGADAAAGVLYDDLIVSGVADGTFDLLIALGGDGTMLRSAHLCAPYGVPFLGINMGRLGFLMGIQGDEWRDWLPKLMQGAFWIEDRMMLRAEQVRGGQKIANWVVMNETMVGRGEVMRPIRLSVTVDGCRLTTFIADGLIAATPTGSTAYALAAGGPILPPDLRNILLVPVAPHLSVDRAIVLAEGSAVEIDVSTRHKAALSVDGQHSVPLLEGDRVHVRACEFSARFVRLQEQGYFYRNLTSQMNQHASDPALDRHIEPEEGTEIQEG